MIQKLIKEYILESKSKNDEKSNYAIGLATTSYKFDAYFSFPRKIKDWGYYFILFVLIQSLQIMYYHI